MKPQAAKFVITLKGNEIKKFAFPKGENVKAVIGKNKSVVDIPISSSYVSGKHLELSKDSYDNLYVKDLNSTNGTYINKKRIAAGKKVQIKINDIITFTDSSDIQLLVLPPSYASPHANAQNSGGGYRLNKNMHAKTQITIGRSSSCDFVIPASIVSRKHATLIKNSDGTYTLIDNNSSNGTYINDSLLTGSRNISQTDSIKIGNKVFSLSDLLGGKTGGSQTGDLSSSIAELLKNKNSIVIGRSKEADFRINDNLISRKHTQITKEGDKYFVIDLGSTNGTYVNEQRISTKVELKAGDELRIGLNILSLNEAERELSNLTAIRAVNVTKKYPNNYVGLQPMSVNIPSRAFIALMGPSGCGKTTLMNTLNGDNPATGGKVLVHGLDLKKNYKTLKQKIGYVPQDDIVHKDLTVDSSLYYAAKLRMNPDTTDEEIKERIGEVLKSLKIDNPKIRTNKVGSLSGGQRKRVSIAVELLNKPAILFLDEPTSPLDPETIDGFLTAIKDLTVTEKTTVIMVTHKPSDLNYVDRVIFLGTAGYQAFYGSENELYNHFSLDDKNIISVYSTLSTPERAKLWNEKWKEKQTIKPQEIKETKGFDKAPEKYSWFAQLYWLTKRYANIKLNDRGNMMLLMAQPIAIPLALVYLFDKLQLGVLFMMAVSAIWFGVSNAAKEIVSEIPIYKRERMFNLNITTYILSKITVLSIIALIQVVLFLQIVKLPFLSDDVHIVNELQATGFLFLLAFSATLLGLLLSVIFDNAEKVMTFIPIILIPQIIFSGVIADIDTKDKEIFSYTMFGRWGTEGLARIQNDFKDYEVVQIDSLLVKSSKFDTVPQVDKMLTPISASVKYERIYKYELAEVLIDTLKHSVYNTVPDIKAAKDTFLLDSDSDTEIPTVKDDLGDSIRKVSPYSKNYGDKSEKGDPLKNLKFYENDKLLNAFGSLEKNILAISLIDILLLISIYVFLKRKDSI